MTPAIQTKPLNLTFEEFLEYDFGEDDRIYELENGEPALMPEPSRQHEDIGDDLADEFKLEYRRCNLPYVVKRFISVKVGSKSGKKPDVVVFLKAHWDEIDRSKPAALTKTPLMVVEIVSGGNWKTDYTKKKTYYLNCGVPEYWILDPIPKGSSEFLDVKEPTISVCLLEGGVYNVTQYRGDDVIPCKIFPELRLTVNQIMNAGRL